MSEIQQPKKPSLTKVALTLFSAGITSIIMGAFFLNNLSDGVSEPPDKTAFIVIGLTLACVGGFLFFWDAKTRNP